MSYDEYDFVYSIGGLQWGRDNVKNFFVNMCTYFSKGMNKIVINTLTAALYIVI